VAEKFDEPTILEKLRDAPRVPWPNPRRIRVARDHYLETVEEDDRADLDEATRAVVEKLGGHLGRTQQAHQERRAGRQVAAPPTVVWFYELPAEALN
jgi:hypothetical protein